MVLLVVVQQHSESVSMAVHADVGCWRCAKVYCVCDSGGAHECSCFLADRALFHFSPLPSTFDRVVHCGDASGIQSPLSFGGFGALTRHLGRISNALAEAIEAGATDKESLSLVNPYMPNLSATWMFQRSMSAV